MLSRADVINMGADPEEIELITWYLSNGCVGVIKYGTKEKDGWLK